MANGASDLLRSLLATHVGVSGWALHSGIAPDQPDKVIQLIDTPGLGRDPDPKWLLDYPSCQIIVRGEVSGYQACRNEAYAVKDTLLGVDSQDVLGDRLVAVNMNGDLGFIGRDEDMRPLFSMNFALIVEPAASAETNRTALP